MARRRALLLAGIGWSLAAAAGVPVDPPRVTPEIENRQPALIDEQVAKIGAHSAPGMQVYFLGFAGVGEQRVFAEEIKFAAARVAARFGAADRSLLLINDRRDLAAYPLASQAGLRYALLALAKVMDPDDVLFLAVSSHGGRLEGAMISNSGMRADSLSRNELAAMLKESGIRWRVIVVSACFAGSFIDTLADSHTIILTAASKYRTSFGCSDDRDLTYFGEAFYRDALPKTASLRAAFELARTGIQTRERELHYRPSQPQAYFGPLLEAKLQEMQVGEVGAR